MVQLPFEVEHRLAWIVAGCFAGLSACITFYQVYNHIKFNSHPTLRRYVIRIILMVPIYALESWLGLRFADIALYFDLLRECYEAFVIYSFYQLLVTYLGGERKIVSVLAKKENKPHVFPFCCLPAWRMSDRFQIQLTDDDMQRLEEAHRENIRHQQQQQRNNNGSESKETMEGLIDEEKGMPLVHPASSMSVNTSPDYSSAASSAEVASNRNELPEIPRFQENPHIDSHHTLSASSSFENHDFLTHTQLGTLQYCIVKPVTALLAFVLSLLDLYGDSTFDWSRGYPYLAFVTNMSQIWAMYTLVLFYMVCKEDLKGLNPIPKFLCVKAVVFFTFWQSVFIAILASFDILHETQHYTKDQVVVALQDFIVCLEMLVAALAHHFAFSWKSFHDPALGTHLAAREGRDGAMLPALIEALNVTDVYVQDVRRVTVKSLKKKSKDNRVLTKEELHEMQYASFVAAQNKNGDSSSGQWKNSEQLMEPLNPEDSDDPTLAHSDAETHRVTFFSPSSSKPSTTSASSTVPVARVEIQREVHRVKEKSSPAVSPNSNLFPETTTSSTVTVIERAHVSPLDDLLAPPDEAAPAAVAPVQQQPPMINESELLDPPSVVALDMSSVDPMESAVPESSFNEDDAVPQTEVVSSQPIVDEPESTSEAAAAASIDESNEDATSAASSSATNAGGKKKAKKKGRKN